MGVVREPKDILKGRRKLIESGLRDLSPGLRDSVLKVFEAWEGEASEDRLIALIGRGKTKRLIESLKR